VSTCPVCESSQVLIAVSPPGRGACRECGARWVQGDEAPPGAEPSTIPNVIGVIRPAAAEATASLTDFDRRG
jgi:hypothetical protein